MQHPTSNRPVTTLRPGLALALALCAALFAAGCSELKLPEPAPEKPQAPTIQPTADLSADASQAFINRDMIRSELLYSRLLERGDITKAQRMAALERLAESAFNSRHYYQAKQALDRLASMDQSRLGTWAWHELYIKTIGALDRPDLVNDHQAWLTAHTELPYEVRARGAIAFSEIYTRNGDFMRAVNTLARVHKQAPDKTSKAAMEADYTRALREMPQPQLLGLAKLVGNANPRSFPHALIQREAMRRGQGGHATSPGKPELAPAHAGLTPESSPLSVMLAQSNRTRSDQPASLLPAPRGVVRIALALPLSGRFAPTGWKVLRGAGAAQAMLAAQGRMLEIKAINTDAADWREQLAALPPDFRVIGGPLQVDSYKAMESAGLTRDRAVFAFVPDLGGLQEGSMAWRFFPSARDQVRALVELTADKLGIRSVAVLAPRNRYGQRMSEIFQAEAKAKGLRLAATGTYPPDDHPRWKQSVAQLLKVPDAFRGNKNIPLPMPDFGAVFVPEDWTPSELLVSNFHFYEGEHLLFLGTELWSVALDNLKDVDDTYFQQAACPGAWWPDSPQAKALQAQLDKTAPGQGSPAVSQADFWVALGHDFIQMAARLNIPNGFLPEQLNEQLVGMQGVPYGMAPMQWNHEGRASQKLFIFAPRKTGKVLVDAEELRQSLTKAKDRRERRLSTAREIRKAKDSKQ